jgi:hypothetical protein
MIKLLGVLLMILVMAGTFVHITDAAPYEKQADSKYVKKKIVKPYSGKSGWWVYILTVCADDYALGITEVILSSDAEARYLGVNKSIPKSECSTYGAVMQAKNGDTLGYKITTTSEAVEKIVASKHEKRESTNWSEISRYKFILGYY